MTKAKYMALDDIQSLWTNQMKTWVNQQKADKSTTYTKTEVDTMMGNAEPYYDSTNRCIICP